MNTKRIVEMILLLVVVFGVGIFSGKVLYDKVNEKDSVKEVKLDNNKESKNDTKTKNEESSGYSLKEIAPLFDGYLSVFKRGLATFIEAEDGSFSDLDYAFFASQCCSYASVDVVKEELYKYFNVNSFDLDKANEEAKKSFRFINNFVELYEKDYRFTEPPVDYNLTVLRNPDVSMDGEYYVVTYDIYYASSLETGNNTSSGKRKFYLKYNKDTGNYNIVKIFSNYN